jgi:hypothetical protein
LNYILVFGLLFLLSCFGKKSMFRLVLDLVLVKAHWFALQYETIRAIILELYYVLFCCKIRGSLYTLMKFSFEVQTKPRPLVFSYRLTLG